MTTQIPQSVVSAVRTIIDEQPESIRAHVEMDIIMLMHTICGMCRHPYMSSDWFVHNAQFGQTANGLALKLSEKLNFEASSPIVNRIREALAAEGMHLQGN